ncbi:hypothetical protein [Streptomyces sp. bgisy060]|uniref:hypothetical protein n=1 Tax=Streptomyces sp. bgisy060 TaxID=3413775 RepID=UPI003EB75F1E
MPSLTHRVYAFESSFSPDIVWTRLDHVDFTPAAPRPDRRQPGRRRHRPVRAP